MERLGGGGELGNFNKGEETRRHDKRKEEKTRQRKKKANTHLQGLQKITVLFYPHKVCFFLLCPHMTWTLRLWRREKF